MQRMAIPQPQQSHAISNKGRQLGHNLKGHDQPEISVTITPGGGYAIPYVSAERCYTPNIHVQLDSQRLQYTNEETRHYNAQMQPHNTATEPLQSPLPNKDQHNSVGQAPPYLERQGATTTQSKQQTKVEPKHLSRRYRIKRQQPGCCWGCNKRYGGWCDTGAGCGWCNCCGCCTRPRTIHRNRSTGGKYSNSDTDSSFCGGKSRSNCC